MSNKTILAIMAVVVLFFVCISAYAGPQQDYLERSRISQEKKALTQYIVATTKNSKKSLTVSKAKQIIDWVYEYSAIHGTDPLLVLAMMRNESGFSPKATSKYGAKGLLQVVPRYHREKLQGRNPYDVSTNIDVGIQVLKEYLEQNNNKVPPTLKKYSGGSKNYFTKVAKTHKEMSRYLVTTAFEGEQPITVVHSIDKPSIPSMSTVSFEVAVINYTPTKH